MSAPANISMVGLIVLGGLNVALGILLALVSFRLSSFSKLLSEVESRVSRLEVITNLTESRRTKQSQGSS